jgi:hypothetical protein
MLSKYEADFLAKNGRRVQTGKDREPMRAEYSAYKVSEAWRTWLQR